MGESAPTNRRQMAKTMAHQACVLLEQIKTKQAPNHAEKINNDINLGDKNTAAKFHEATQLAQEAIRLAPRRPYGYTALSMISTVDPLERIEALEKAVDLSSANPSDRMGYVVLSSRLLIEPRQWKQQLQENKALLQASNSNFATGTKKGKHKHDWSDKDEMLYTQLAQALEEAWNHSNKGTLESEDKHKHNQDRSVPDKEEDDPCSRLAQVDYRVGCFLRKMQPPDLFQPRSRLHLQRCCQMLPSSHPLRETAVFWLATVTNSSIHESLQNDNNMSHDENHVGQQVAHISKCPERYVVGLYSTFAERFDDLLLHQLAYRTPLELRRLLDRVIATKQLQLSKDKITPEQSTSMRAWKAVRAADLGCGTGLSGLAFRDMADHLTGVDLSPEMITKARQKKKNGQVGKEDDALYDDLVVGDVTCVLQGDPMYDLILSCDVFVYLGDLKEVFVAAHKSLSRQGMFAFSTEFLPHKHDTDSPGFVLQSCARFAHSKRYIETLALEVGFHVLALEVCPNIRRNGGQDVKGMLIVLTPRE